MKITILSVGSIKEKYLKDAIIEYSKRISKYAALEFICVPDEIISENKSETDIKIKKHRNCWPSYQITALKLH